MDITKGLESPDIYRQWVAITTIGAVLQQKVHAEIQGIIFPNLYTFLVGKPGIGKSRPIVIAERIIMQVPEILRSPTSVTMASLVDKLDEAKRGVVTYPNEDLEYNSLFVIADELSNFMNDFTHQADLISGLTKFYDCTAYSQARRTGRLEKSIDRPQVSIIAGSTPTSLMHFIPVWAWDQGFTSRIIMIYCADKPPLLNPFESPDLVIPDEMAEDLRTMDKLKGGFGWTKEYATAAPTWRDSGMDPAPTHPKLVSYCERRWTHFLKLSMISSVDRGNDLTLTLDDFKRAQRWLLEAEHHMPGIFQAGAAIESDSKIMDEIAHFIAGHPKGCPEHMIKNFARKLTTAQTIIPILNAMEQAGLIKAVSVERLGTRVYAINSPEQAKA